MQKTQRQLSLFEDQRLDLEGAIQLSLMSLTEYGQRYQHWCVAYSGGKDSSATVTFVAWAIKTGQVPAPQSLSILYADTRQELPPLQQTAMRLLDTLRGDGFNAQVVLPALDDRYFVYMLGRGVPPPNNMTLRWCTPQIKVEPMHKALAGLRERAGQKILMLTGVRIGESAARDQRIAVSCSKDSGECGQGWFQNEVNEMGFPSLAPIVHWRVCNVFDWLYFEQATHGYPVTGITAVYGDDDIRTGCYRCHLVEEDRPLTKLAHTPGWEQLGALQELRQVYEWLERHENRLKLPLSYNKDSSIKQKSGTVGPLTMEARKMALSWILDIERRAGVVLIDEEEETRIRELWALNTWPDGWTGNEPVANELQPAIRVITKTNHINGKKCKEAIGYVTQINLDF